MAVVGGYGPWRDTTGGWRSTLRAAVAERLGESRFGLWFGEGVRLGVDGDALEVGVPNAFFREWIQGHFAGNLIEAAEAVTGRALRLAFRVDDEAEPDGRARDRADARPTTGARPDGPACRSRPRVADPARAPAPATRGPRAGRPGGSTTS